VLHHQDALAGLTRGARFVKDNRMKSSASVIKVTGSYRASAPRNHANSLIDTPIVNDFQARAGEQPGGGNFNIWMVKVHGLICAWSQDEA
jgi:hypothetical protein